MVKKMKTFLEVENKMGPIIAALAINIGCHFLKQIPMLESQEKKNSDTEEKI